MSDAIEAPSCHYRSFMSLFDYPTYNPVNGKLHKVDTCATTLCDCEKQTILTILKKSKSGQK